MRGNYLFWNSETLAFIHERGGVAGAARVVLLFNIQKSLE